MEIDQRKKNNFLNFNENNGFTYILNFGLSKMMYNVQKM